MLFVSEFFLGVHAMLMSPDSFRRLLLGLMLLLLIVLLFGECRMEKTDFSQEIGALIHNGDYHEAWLICLKWQNKEPYNANRFIQMGRISLAQGNRFNARVNFDQARIMGHIEAQHWLDRCEQ